MCVCRRCLHLQPSSMCRASEKEVVAQGTQQLASAATAMDPTLRDGLSPPPIPEESADSEQWTSDAALLPPRGGLDQMVDDDDDDDAESCNCDPCGRPCHVYDSCDDDGGRGDVEESPACWWAWLVQNAAGCERGGEEVGRGEEEEVASVKPVAALEDRLFWEACLAEGYP